MHTQKSGSLYLRSIGVLEHESQLEQFGLSNYEVKNRIMRQRVNFLTDASLDSIKNMSAISHRRVLSFGE